MTIIEAKKDLYNGGKCFTKGKQYTVNGDVNITPGLMEKQTINDQGEPHIIGSFWREFKIISVNKSYK